MSSNSESEIGEYLTLYRTAFEKFGARALWNARKLENPSAADALVIARLLRVEGNLAARRMAEQIERACHAAH